VPLALVPSLDQQPLVRSADLDQLIIDDSAPCPARLDDVAGLDDPDVVSMRRVDVELRDDVLGGRGESQRISVAALVDGLLGLDELVDPVESPDVGLPDREA
jgi:hypothetical protein